MLRLYYPAWGFTVTKSLGEITICQEVTPENEKNTPISRFFKTRYEPNNFRHSSTHVRAFLKTY